MAAHDERLCPEIRNLLECGRVHEAYQLAIQQNPPAADPFFRDIDEGDLLRALQTKPAALAFLEASELREVQVRVALLYAGCRAPRESAAAWPHRMSVETAAGILAAAAQIGYSFECWRRSKLVETVRIVCSMDGPCSVCASRRDASPYRLEGAPLPPFAECLSLEEHGCRCILVAAKIEGVDLL